MLKIDPRQLRWLRVRVVVVAVLVAAGYIGIVRRAHELQVVENRRFQNLAAAQAQRFTEIPPRRGTIFDRTGARLAMSVDVDSISANPRAVGDDAPIVAQQLSDLLKIPRKDIERKLEPTRYFTWLARRVDDETAKKVAQLSLEGVSLIKEPKRFYPAGGVAGPVLGFADSDARGIEGLELALDRSLRGERVGAPSLRDALGREVMAHGLPNAQAADGADVVLTIDRVIQLAAERSLAAAIERHKAKAGSVTVIDPHTGDVLALASWPTYDPNDPKTAVKRGSRNRSITDAYEPGSTMKTFSIAAAVEAGAVRPQQTWDCMNGQMRITGTTIHDTHPHKILTTEEVLAKSSNIGTTKIAFALGKTRLERFLRQIGFGRPTGIELPGEAAGRLRGVGSWGPTDLATISFGQAMTATPLQLVQGLAAIANQGILVPPRLVQKIVDARGKVLKQRPEPPVGRRVMSEETARAMVAMLKKTTDTGGTAETLVLPGYKVAGKTGTAQRVDPATRRYSADKWVSSFMGFVPADRLPARLAILVVIEEPAGQHYGSIVAAPVFREVAEHALKYLGVPPAPELLMATKANEAAKTGKPMMVDAPVWAPAKAGKNAKNEALAQVELAAEPGPAEMIVPDFTGFSIAQALELGRKVQMDLTVRGSGVAVGQTPGPGPAPIGSVCRIQFRPPG